MDLKIRKELKTEQRLLEIKARDTFWNFYEPGCNEHLIINNLRNSDFYIEKLSFVLEKNGEIIGAIMFSESFITTKNKDKCNTITLGPLFIIKEEQNNGYGKMLVDYALLEAKKYNFKAVLLFGYPDYYKKLGFVLAAHLAISTFGGQYPFALMIKVLNQDICIGEYTECFSFETDDKILSTFDLEFPTKIKSHKSSQDKFAQMLEMFVDESEVGILL